jgi:2-phosphosulfolactate phosphatase
VGAGAVVERLTAEEPGVELSPEAEAAAAAFRWLRPLAQCPSGVELIDKGYADDVTIAEQVDASDVVPVMVEGRFVAV